MHSLRDTAHSLSERPHPVQSQYVQKVLELQAQLVGVMTQEACKWAELVKDTERADEMLGSDEDESVGEECPDPKDKGTFCGCVRAGRVRVE